MLTVSARPQPPNRDVFIVRRWLNPADGSWRGQIVHVGSGQTVNFASDEQLVAYLRRRLCAQVDETGRSGLR